MLKPYTRQQIQTDKVLSAIGNSHYRNMLKRILTHEDTLYNIISNTKSNTLLSSIVTNTDNVVIVADDVLYPVILDRYGGYALDTLERLFVGTVRFTVCGEKYIIETNYESVHDVYDRLPIYS